MIDQNIPDGKASATELLHKSTVDYLLTFLHQSVSRFSSVPVAASTNFQESIAPAVGIDLGATTMNDVQDYSCSCSLPLPAGYARSLTFATREVSESVSWP